MFIHHAAVVAISMLILVTIMLKILNAFLTRNGEISDQTPEIGPLLDRRLRPPRDPNESQDRPDPLPERRECALNQIPGVVENGLFNRESSGMVVGRFDGTAEVILR